MSRKGLNSWLKENMARPAVLGDEHFAFRLHARLMREEGFVSCDSEALLNEYYTPNILVVVGPLNHQLENEVSLCKKRSSPECKVIYVESLSGKERVDQALKSASSLNAISSVLKEFVAIDDVVKAIKENAGV